MMSVSLGSTSTLTQLIDSPSRSWWEESSFLVNAAEYRTWRDKETPAPRKLGKGFARVMSIPYQWMELYRA